MPLARPAVVVVTPVKNEEAILDRFLAVTSQFADGIIVADQRSTDGSRAIASRYPKVTVVENDSDEYSEAARQRLLLDKARELVKGPRLILALDADELVAANAPMTAGWRRMLSARPGTVLCYEKPDLYASSAQCIRYDTPWPLGYMDDGAEHRPRAIHSIRIPTPAGAPRMHVADVKVLHYGLIALEKQRAKNRLYCVVENIRRTSPIWRRRVTYAASFDWRSRGRFESSPREWFDGWEGVGIDVTSVAREPYEWYDTEVLRYFEKYGVRRFWADDIWDRDWEQCRRDAVSSGVSGVPDDRIVPPPAPLAAAMALFDKTTSCARRARRLLRRP